MTRTCGHGMLHTKCAVTKADDRTLESGVDVCAGARGDEGSSQRDGGRGSQAPTGPGTEAAHSTLGVRAKTDFCPGDYSQRAWDVPLQQAKAEKEGAGSDVASREEADARSVYIGSVRWPRFPIARPRVPQRAALVCAAQLHTAHSIPAQRPDCIISARSSRTACRQTSFSLLPSG